MAASMMNQELLPSVHMMLWLWGAKRSDQRLQVKEEEGAEPEKPGEPRFSPRAGFNLSARR